MAEVKALTYFSTDIGDFVFDAFYSIQHDTSLVITENPVQTGSSISDHAYMQSKELTFEIGMSDVMNSIVQGQFSDENSRSVSAYKTLRRLQAERLPIQAVTRLGTYQNMLVETISTVDNNTTLTGLRATVTLKEIFVAAVTTIKISARPQTSDVTNNGDQKVQQADESLLEKIKNLF